MSIDPTYLHTLADRKKESHVYKKFQLIGLEVAQILGDEKHKSLYIKLAQKHGEDILRIAKEVAERGNVVHRGAYFMKIISAEKSNARHRNNS